MRLLITADLHYNHPKSKPLADDLIDRMNAAGGDALLIIGDTASNDGDALEQCLSRFHLHHAIKLFVAGNHELWTAGPDSHHLYTTELPRRVRAVGWHWLEDEPFVAGRTAIVGSIGWYDYSFAQAELGIPLRFYQHKISPGAAARCPEYSHLLQDASDLSPAALELYARWNDGRFVKLHRSDEQFLADLQARLERQLASLSHLPQLIVATHHLPFRQLLPPPHSAQWDFAKAYLGSAKMGDLLLNFPNITHLYCGHSHLPIEARVGHLQAINIGCGYRWKTFQILDLPD